METALAYGTRVEGAEHGLDATTAQKVAQEHLRERADYYEGLHVVEHAPPGMWRGDYLVRARAGEVTYEGAWSLAVQTALALVFLLLALYWLYRRGDGLAAALAVTGSALAALTLGIASGSTTVALNLRT